LLPQAEPPPQRVQQSRQTGYARSFLTF
jgi:hypothetical protein